jgi:hypothetical protein
MGMGDVSSYLFVVEKIVRVGKGALRAVPTVFERNAAWWARFRFARLQVR